jgi:hypothetical protein
VTGHERNRPAGDARDRAFAERALAHYGPKPTRPTENAAFDAALWARLSRRPARWLLAPALAVAVTALLWLGLSPAPRSDVAGDLLDISAAWEGELFLGDDVSPSRDRDTAVGLPDDYAAVAAVFLDG